MNEILISNEVFGLAHCDAVKVVLKVKELSNFEIAMHPYVNREYDYITVTRGENHLLTVIKKDGSTFSFHWGKDGYTLISDELKTLRDKVVDFIESECFIMLGWDDDNLDEAVVFYNVYYKSWQLTLYGMRNGHRLSAHYRPYNKVSSAEEIMKFAENFIDVDGWEPKTAETGISIWNAILD